MQNCIFQIICIVIYTYNRNVVNVKYFTLILLPLFIAEHIHASNNVINIISQEDNVTVKLYFDYFNFP